MVKPQKTMPYTAAGQQQALNKLYFDLQEQSALCEHLGQKHIAAILKKCAFELGEAAANVRPGRIGRPPKLGRTARSGGAKP